MFDCALKFSVINLGIIINAVQHPPSGYGTLTGNRWLAQKNALPALKI